MTERIHLSIQEPLRHNPSFDERWNSPDGGLITCWESGRMLAEKHPEIVTKAKAGELPVLGWRGGVEKKPKSSKPKYGPLFYLAQWQGLRGDDLDIDLSIEKTITCSRTGVPVIFTNNSSKYAEA